MTRTRSRLTGLSSTEEDSAASPVMKKKRRTAFQVMIDKTECRLLILQKIQGAYYKCRSTEETAEALVFYNAEMICIPRTAKSRVNQYLYGYDTVRKQLTRGNLFVDLAYSERAFLPDDKKVEKAIEKLFDTCEEQIYDYIPIGYEDLNWMNSATVRFTRGDEPVLTLLRVLTEEQDHEYVCNQLAVLFVTWCAYHRVSCALDRGVADVLAGQYDNFIDMSGVTDNHKLLGHEYIWVHAYFTFITLSGCMQVSNVWNKIQLTS